MPDSYDLKPDDVAQIKRLIAVFRDLLGQVTSWGEIIGSLPGQMALLASAVRESSEDEAEAIRELRTHIRRLEELELLRQAGREDSARAKGLRTNIQNEHSLEHLQEMLLTVTRNLQRVQLKKAKLGGNLDLELENKLDELVAAKEEIERQLKELGGTTGRF